MKVNRSLSPNRPEYASGSPLNVEPAPASRMSSLFFQRREQSRAKNNHSTTNRLRLKSTEKRDSQTAASSLIHHRRGQSVLTKGQKMLASTSVFDDPKTLAIEMPRPVSTCETMQNIHKRQFSTKALRAPRISKESLQDKLEGMRDKMKTQQQGRHSSFDHQGGFHSGFVHSKKPYQRLKQDKLTSSQLEASLQKRRASAPKQDDLPLEKFLTGYSKAYKDHKRPSKMTAYKCKANYLKEPYHKPQSIAVSPNMRKDNFIDSHVKQFGWVPPVAKYEGIKDWALNFGKRGRFSRKAKVTLTESILVENKKNPSPAPTTYEFKEFIGKGNKHPSKPTYNQAKFCSFIEQAKWQGHQTPGTKHTVSHRIPDLNPKAAKIHRPSDNEKVKDSRMARIGRDRSQPAPGDYNTEAAWKSTQVGKREHKVSQEKRINFTDVIKNSKKYLPGCGHYKYDTKATFNRLSTSPLGVKRH